MLGNFAIRTLCFTYGQPHRNFPILYLIANVAATVEMTEARLAGESDAKNLGKWKFKRFAVGFCGSATPIVLLSAVLLGDADWDITYGDSLMAYSCVLYGIGGLLTIGAALTHAPEPPAQRLLGKSPDWVNAYTEAYQKSIKRYNAIATFEGCVAGTFIPVIVLYPIVVSAAGGTPGGN